MKQYLLVALGGGLGSLLRFSISQGWPLKTLGFTSTLTVNIIGSFLLGILLAFQQKNVANFYAWYCLLGIGFCGGLTTFSTFSVETIQLLLANKYSLFLTNIFASITAGLLAAYIGFQAAK